MEVEDRKPKRLLSTDEILERIGCRSPTTMYSLIRKGELPQLIRRGSRSFLLESDIDTYIERLAVANRGPRPEERGSR